VLAQDGVTFKKGSVTPTQTIEGLMQRLKLGSDAYLMLGATKLDPADTAEAIGIKEGDRLEILPRKAPPPPPKPTPEPPQKEKAAPPVDNATKGDQESKARTIWDDLDDDDESDEWYYKRMREKEEKRKAAEKAKASGEKVRSCICGYPSFSEEALQKHLNHPANKDNPQHRPRTDEEQATYDVANAAAEARINAANAEQEKARDAGKETHKKLLEDAKARAAEREPLVKELAHHFEQDNVKDPEWQGLGLPRVIILVGVQGSGKSYFSDEMEARGWANVNDETSKAAAKGKKERRGCPILELFEEHLRDGIRDGRHVVVDRANCEPRQREKWLKNVTRKEGLDDKLVAVVVLDTPLATCEQRVRDREDHFLSEKNVKVCSTWHKALQAQYPSTKEGFGAVYTLKSDRKREAFLELFQLHERRAEDSEGQ